ncbi:MAG TPA: hypothetical protein VFS21_33180, partial [Roseiflexaceae bacterium]|nr:hypothetical protein [Roseiflexaceae bacterium]
MTSHPIRPFTPADAEAAEELLRQSWGHDPRMQAIYRVHRDWPEVGLLRRTLVRPAGAGLAGVGTLFESTIHPLRLFATINVAPGWRGRGVGTALFDALARLG